MDVLFIIVAELLIVPLILWALIMLELTVGVAASAFAIFAGRRSLSKAVMHSWRVIRRRLLWSLIFLSSGLLLADLVFFDAIVHLALRAADDREDLEVDYGHAEGSFILGRIELHQLELTAVRGGDEPSVELAFAADSLIIDIDTKRLLMLDFVVEELALEGLRGSVDRLRESPAEPRAERELAHEFRVERLHFGDVKVALRDHTQAPARELEVVLAELDLGPVASESLVFDLLYRVRGRGSIAGHDFTLTTSEAQGVPQTTLEVQDLPLGPLASAFERSAGVRVQASADLHLVNRYLEGGDPQVEINVALQLRDLELEAAGELSVTTRLLLQVAQRELKRLGRDFPLEFGISVRRSELLGLRNLVESGIVERLTSAIATALRSQLAPKVPGKLPGQLPGQPAP